MKVGLIVLSAIAIMNMVSLAVILILKKPDCKKNRLLALILMVPAYSIILNAIRYIGVLSDYSFLIAFEYVFLYSWPPPDLILCKINDRRIHKLDF